MLLRELRISGNKKKNTKNMLQEEVVLDSCMWEQAQCCGLSPRSEIMLVSINWNTHSILCFSI